MKLEGKTAIVTGGSRGIGKQICLTLAREGANVVVAARTEAEGARLPGTIHQTVKEIQEQGGTALAVRTDITVDDDVEQMVATTLREFGRWLSRGASCRDDRIKPSRGRPRGKHT